MQRQNDEKTQEINDKWREFRKKINVEEKKPYNLILFISTFVSLTPFVGILIPTLIGAFANFLLPLVLSGIVPVVLFIIAGIVENTKINNRNIYRINNQEITGEDREKLIILIEKIFVAAGIYSSYHDETTKDKLEKLLNELNEQIEIISSKTDEIISSNVSEDLHKNSSEPGDLTKNSSEPGGICSK